MNCPRSIKLKALVPKVEESPHAAEGTAAHELAEMCLRDSLDPEDFIGLPIDGFEVGEEMAEAVRVYVDFCRQFKGEAEIEKRFNLGFIHKDIFGTADFSVYNPDSKALSVVDYKHGKGVVVSPEWNSQLMIYSLGASWGHDDCEKISMTIVQPRAYHEDGVIRSWFIDKKDLYSWAFDVLRPAALRTEDENARIEAGAHCRFCKAIAICPAQSKRALEIAKTDFENPVLPDPEKMTPEQISKVIELSGAFSSWADRVRSYAKARLELGDEIPGFKLVERRSNRIWAPGNARVEDFLKEKLGEGAYVKKLVSPAGAERALKKSGIKAKEAKDLLEPLWVKPDRGTTIVPSEDKRTAVAIPIVEEFSDNIAFLK